jgi:hypothetical protein
VAQSKSGWSLPGGDRKVRLADGSEATLAQLNYARWQTGAMLAPSLLREHQMPLYRADISLGEQEVAVQMCSRQFGKSFEKLTLAIETAIQNPNASIRFAFPSKSQGQEILEGNIRLILATCPPDLSPDVRIESGYIKFANGSKIVVAGTDDRDQKERLRGTGAKLIVVDEAGSHKDLRYIVDSILGPQLDNHKGRMILITTPPPTLDHAFYEYKRDAVIANRFLKYTIYDNTHYDRAQKLKICARVNRLPADHEDAVLILDGKMPGNIDWRREYLCEEVADDKLRVTPDYRDEAPHVQVFSRPMYCTHYVFLDQGYHDYFAAVFASHNHAAQKLFVEDVWMGKRLSTDRIVSELKSKERALGWGTPPRRFANDPRGQQQLRDMRDRGYAVTQGPKAEGATFEADRVNLTLAAGKLVLHERCKPLRDQLKAGIFKINENGKAEFARTENYGHLDAFAALAMGLRHVDWRRDVTPPDEFDPNDYFVPPGMKRPLTGAAAVVNQMFRGAFKQ